MPFALPTVVLSVAIVLLVCALYQRLSVHHRALERQAKQLAEQAQLLDLANDAILVWDFGSGTIRMWSRGAEVLYGWSKAEVQGRALAELLQTQFPRPLPEINAQLMHDQHWEGELVHTCRDGRVVVVASRWALRPDAQGEPAAVLGINTDITGRKEFEARLQYQALHDPLTGLPNRALFNDRLEQALAQAARHASRVGVLFLDIDHFKAINDTHGHQAGDAVLIEVAQRLRRCLRATDTVARLGGDEFICLLGDLGDASEADAVVERIQCALSAPVSLELTPVRVSASVGVALGAAGTAPETLLRQADHAMYQAKQQQRRVSVAAADSGPPPRPVRDRTSPLPPPGSD